ncbi:MAG TPA: hypothetical protein VFU73_03995 [Actinocrinis sp.]|nr:hypothetical protein [Actinocrinis sp.]
MTEEIGPRLTDDELRALIRLLVRYCRHDLDQFDDWRLAMPWGEAYVSVSNAPLPGAPREAYREIWPFPPKLALQEPPSPDSSDASG